MPRTSCAAAFSSLLLVSLSAACGADDAGPGDAASTAMTAALPEGAEALSLLGQPLFPAPRAPEVAAVQEADVEAARADYDATQATRTPSSGSGAESATRGGSGRRAAALVDGEPDEVEPDGQPNALGIPTSTLQSNIHWRAERAAEMYGRILEGSGWAGFGHIAAEAEVARSPA